ncbi:MAG: AGE family epimerase/isomerase, partial [Oleiharenicola lentus]
MKSSSLLLLCTLALVTAGRAAPVPAAPVAPADLHAYAAAAEKELKENILPFWLKNARNEKNGGFHAFIGEDMSVRDDQPRGALLTARILWTFSATYRKYHDPEHLAMAQWAYRDLTEHFTDKEHGGLFWTISRTGAPLDAHKQVYMQVFGIYALSEYYRATGEQAALDGAIAIYRLIEKHAADPKHGGYFDSLTREWGRERGSAGNLLGAAPKSQNSHIHILEAYTSLIRAW